RHPMSPSQVGGRDGARPLHQLGELLGSALERQPAVAGFERYNCVHLAADLENEVVFPLDFLGAVREREAVLPDPINVHCGCSFCRRSTAEQTVMGLKMDDTTSDRRGTIVGW